MGSSLNSGPFVEAFLIRVPYNTGDLKGALI